MRAFCIVLIQGIAGSSETWKADSGVTFPELMEGDPDIASRFDIHELDYLSHTGPAPVVPSPAAIVDAVKAALSRLLRTTERCRSSAIASVAMSFDITSRFSASKRMTNWTKSTFGLARNTRRRSSAQSMLDLLGRLKLIQPNLSGSYRAA